MSVITIYLNDNAQTPLNRFVVYMLYSQLCNKHSDKSNPWSLGLHTKYEVSMFTHYEDMKGDEKCKNWGCFGIGVTQGHQKHHHLIEHIRLPIRL